MGKKYSLEPMTGMDIPWSVATVAVAVAVAVAAAVAAAVGVAAAAVATGAASVAGDAVAAVAALGAGEPSTKSCFGGLTLQNQQDRTHLISIMHHVHFSLYKALIAIEKKTKRHEIKHNNKLR